MIRTIAFLTCWLLLLSLPFLIPCMLSVTSVICTAFHIWPFSPCFPQSALLVFLVPLSYPSYLTLAGGNDSANFNLAGELFALLLSRTSHHHCWNVARVLSFVVSGTSFQNKEVRLCSSLFLSTACHGPSLRRTVSKSCIAEEVT